MKRMLVLAASALALVGPAAAQDHRPRPPVEARRDDPSRRPAPPPRRDLNPGQYLPPSHRGQEVADPDRLRLRAPPDGYDWVRVGRGVYLTQRSTGLVVEALPDGR